MGKENQIVMILRQLSLKKRLIKLEYMETIKIKSNESEYSFSCLKSENKITYHLFQNDKLINKAVDLGDGIELNGKSMDYVEFAEMYLLLRAIIKTDTNLMGEYIATTETKLFDL